MTAPAAIRSLLPYFPANFGKTAYQFLWQVSAAIVARFASDHDVVPELNEENSHEAINAKELVLKSIEHGDEHVIKFAEACLREDALRPDAVYRIAAEAVLRQVKPLPRSA